MLRKPLQSLVLVSVMLAISVAPAFAGVDPIDPLTPPPSTDAGGLVDETPQAWFVELSGAPTSGGNLKANLDSEHQKFREAAQAAGLEYQEKFSYETLWNGFSVSVKPSEIGKLNRIPGVKAIYPVVAIPAPQTTASTIDPELYTALAMSGADAAQSELGYTGQGIKVAVMDTGIDFDHPDLGGCFGAGCRVFTGWDFVGDAFNADDTSPSYNPVPSPDPIPDDCNGHGTHVAGIIGANGAVTGVAPNVTFGAYRVFGCQGSTTSDIMLAAMERMHDDGMQILNMSIGSAYNWPQYPTAVAASHLVDEGIVVVASIGNNGANGLYAAGAPGLGEKVIGVASYDNTHVYLYFLTSNDRDIGYIPMTFSPPIPTSGSGEIVNAGLGCAAYPAGSLTGKVALIARGTCSFGAKAANAINAGAVAVLISNNTAGVFAGTLGAAIPNGKPVVGISLADGNFLRAQTTPLTMTWTNQQGSFASPTGGLISSFSSYGLSPDLTLKPDIGAPGGNIYSTFPLESGGYATLSGTSMSSPHVAGAVALLLEAKPKTEAVDVRDILQNTAQPTVWWGNPGLGFLDNVHRQGAGMVQIDDAILNNVKVAPGKISAGESQSGPFSTKLKIENKGKTTITYDLSFVNALSTGGTIAPTFWGSDASVTFKRSSVTVKGGSDGEVKLTITPATGPANGQYGGYIVLTPRGGGQVLRVPFAGFVGDYQSIQVLANPFGLPWLTDQFLNDPVAPFTLVNGDLPYVIVHLEHQSRLFRIEAYDAVTGEYWHKVVETDYMIRNSSASGYFAFGWDGTTTQGNGGHVFTVPNGSYVLKLSILKALGNKDNPADWETWTSPAFDIARP